MLFEFDIFNDVVGIGQPIPKVNPVEIVLPTYPDEVKGYPVVPLVKLFGLSCIS
jgi:hypothetical protein